MPKKQVTWLPIFGNAEIVDGVLKYTPVLIAEGENAGTPAVALMKSNQMFESGTVTLRARVSDPEGKVQIGFCNGHNVEVFVGLNIGSAAYGIATLSNSRWDNFRTAAYGTPPPVDRDVTLKVTVAGSQVTMWVDEVEVVRGTYPIRRAQLTVLLRGTGPVEAELLSVDTAPSIAFVVMQFTDEFNALYQEVITPVCHEYGFAPVRADDIYNNGLIVEDIARSIRESALVIADITPNNPNVYYEVGYAHGLAKATILLAERRRESLPFDVSGFRTIFYDNTIGGKSMVEERLRKHIANLQSL
jgi:hypothetical protein